jgi:acyl carrier protein
MRNETLLAELTAIMRLVFADPALEVTPATTADDVPAWDSMNHITLVVEAESRFGVQFLTAEIESLRSVGEFVELIAAKQARAAA